MEQTLNLDAETEELHAKLERVRRLSRGQAQYALVYLAGGAEDAVFERALLFAEAVAD